MLAQVWRGGTRQTALAALLGRDHVTVPVLNDATARAVGVLCGRTGTTDVVDASVVLCARLTNSTVVTSDPEDIRRLDPHVNIEAI